MWTPSALVKLSLGTNAGGGKSFGHSGLLISVRDRGVGGSNPLAPTTFHHAVQREGHVDRDERRTPVNHRVAYVAVSRGQYDTRIYTDDKVKLARTLNRMKPPYSAP